MKRNVDSRISTINCLGNDVCALFSYRHLSRDLARDFYFFGEVLRKTTRRRQRARWEPLRTAHWSLCSTAARPADGAEHLLNNGRDTNRCFRPHSRPPSLLSVLSLSSLCRSLSSFIHWFIKYIWKPKVELCARQWGNELEQGPCLWRAQSIWREIQQIEADRLLRE